MQTIFILLNLACVVWQLKLKNYKTAVFNGFAAGICLMGLINAL